MSRNYDYELDEFKTKIRQGNVPFDRTILGNMMAIVRIDDNSPFRTYNTKYYSPPRKHVLTSTIPNLTASSVLQDIEQLISQYGQLKAVPECSDLICAYDKEEKPVIVMGNHQFAIQQILALDHPLSLDAFIKFWPEGECFLIKTPKGVTDCAVFEQALCCFLGIKYGVLPW